jgi:hypothetical protein
VILAGLPGCGDDWQCPASSGDSRAGCMQLSWHGSDMREQVATAASALSTTTTVAVHHRCITATAFGGIPRKRPRGWSRIDKPKTPSGEAPGRRIRLIGLLRENPAFAGFSY